jgi:hypothetical protein
MPKAAAVATGAAVHEARAREITCDLIRRLARPDYLAAARFVQALYHGEHAGRGRPSPPSLAALRPRALKAARRRPTLAR